MADMFRAAGYATAHVGKWHLGYTPETMPNARGFDHSFGHMGGCIDKWSHWNSAMGEGATVSAAENDVSSWSPRIAEPNTIHCLPMNAPV